MEHYMHSIYSSESGKRTSLLEKARRHNLPVKNNIEEEKTGKLVEQPGWFRDQSKGDLKGKRSKDQNQEVKE